VFAVLLLLGGWLLTATPFGRFLYAIGSHVEAARLSGVKVSVQLLVVYTLCGLLSGVAGVLFAAQQSVGMALAGTGYELNAIAAVVLGGTSLFGGEGSVWGTAAGAAIIAVLGNIMNLSGINPFTQDFLKGIIIVLAVVLQRSFSR
jgi:ribose/xylose/arabinose/galactoside ABC-type transport system permease subunit